MNKFCGECGAILDPVTGKCPNCDKDSQSDAKEGKTKEAFCDQCGAKLVKGKCPNCDKKKTNNKKAVTLENKDVFCDQCGAKLVDGKCPNCSKKKASNIYCDKCGSTLDPVTGKCPVCDNKVLNLSKDLLNKTKEGVENLHLDEKAKDGFDKAKEGISNLDVKSVTSNKKLMTIIIGVIVSIGIIIGVIVGVNSNSVKIADLIDEFTGYTDKLKENYNVFAEATAEEADLKSESNIISLLKERGFENKVVYNYDSEGNSTEIKEAKSSSDDTHPVYYTYYKGEDKNVWTIYSVADIVYAYNNGVLLSENGSIFADYSNETNSYYGYMIDENDMKTVDFINKDTLDNYYKEDVTVDEQEPVVEDNTNTDSISTSEKHVVDMNVWAVQPVYDFDDIDVDFATDFTSIATSYSYTPYFCFNNNSLYTTTYEGGFIFVKDGKFGLGNGIGEVTMEAKYTNYIEKFDNNDIYVVTNVSSEKAEKLKANYYREDEDYIYGLGGSGFPSYAYNTETGEVMEIYDSNWSNEAPSTFDLYSFAVENGMNEGGITVLTSSSSKGSEYLNGYVIVGQDYSKPLDISFDYNVYAVSENIITFAKYNHVSGTDERSYNKRHMVYPLVRDQRITDVVYVDANGNTIASGFETGYPFYEGYAAVKKDGKWGYIDTNGNVVVDFVFDKATPMSDGKAWVIYNGKTGRINLKDMIDNNAIFNDEQIKLDEWTTSGDKYLEVTADVLKKRDQPTTNGYDDGNRVSKGSIETYYDKASADGYTWYKTADQLWIADQNGEWIKELN